jgi:two-component system, OmpR family, sensor kinase
MTSRTRLRRWLAARPLRTRLVAVLLLVVALALFLAGFAATAALRGYLVGLVETRITESAAVFASPRDQPPQTNLAAPPGARDSPLMPNNSYAQMNDAAGQVVRVLPTSAQIAADPPILPALTLKQATATEAEPFDVTTADGQQHWRAVAVPKSDGTGYVMVAASIDAIDQTVAQLIAWQLAIGVLVLLGLGLLGYLIVRRSLAPLEAVEATAAQVAAGNLAVRAPQLDPNTEVGSLAASFNTMVGNLESAFDAQAASEAAARSSEAAARQSEARMRQFVADASHELRTPLTSIRGYSELYRIGAVPQGPKLTEAMGRIEDEAARMGLLVDDLLLLARLDQQRPLERAKVDLVELAAAAVAAARASAPNRPISVAVDQTAEALVVMGDSARLRQVVDNLLGNALRYTPAEAPIVVRVGLGEPEPAGRPTGSPGAYSWARIEVVDHGPGLSPEAAKRVFERFYREDKARSRAAGGSGLGLAIVSAIVAAHGGRVELETSPGQGATFRVLLPA